MNNQEINGGMSAEELAYENQYKPIHLDKNNIELVMKKKDEYVERLKMNHGFGFDDEIPAGDYRAMRNACQIAWCATLVEAINQNREEVTVNEAKEMFSRLFKGEPDGYAMDQARTIIKKYAEEGGTGLEHDPQAAAVNVEQKKASLNYIDLVEAASELGGREFELSNLQKGEILTINTANSVYEFYVISPDLSLCRKNGTQFFYTDMNGTLLGESTLRQGVITEGLRFSANLLEEYPVNELQTSPVVGFYVEKKSPDASDFEKYIAEKPFKSRFED